MKFPTTVRYSLRLLIEIKNSKGPIPLRVISEKIRVPENYLKQLAAKLEKYGVIKGKKGPNGGYVIIRDDMSLNELIEIFTGGVRLVPCVDEDYKCDLIEVCKVKDTWLELNESVKSLFSSIKLKDF